MASGSIVKRGLKYAIKYRISNGNQVIKTIGTKTEAEKALSETLYQIKNGTYKDLVEIGFKGFANKWLSYKESNNEFLLLKIYLEIVNQHLVPYFKQQKLNKISLNDINEYINFKTKEGKLRSKEISRHITVLKMMFKKAEHWGYLSVNPVQSIRKGTVYLSLDETNRFLTLISPRFYPFFYTAVYTGLSMGDLLNLRWKDIDWQNGYIKVKKRLFVLKEIQDPAAGDSTRKISISPMVIKELKRQRKITSSNIDDKIFPGNSSIGNKNIYHVEFVDILKRAGVRKIGFQDLRHTYVALMIRQGKDMRFIQRQLGHSSIAETMSKYGFLLSNDHKSNRQVS